MTHHATWQLQVCLLYFVGETFRELYINLHVDCFSGICRPHYVVVVAAAAAAAAAPAIQYVSACTPYRSEPFAVLSSSAGAPSRTATFAGLEKFGPQWTTIPLTEPQTGACLLDFISTNPLESDVGDKYEARYEALPLYGGRQLPIPGT